MPTAHPGAVHSAWAAAAGRRRLRPPGALADPPDAGRIRRPASACRSKRCATGSRASAIREDRRARCSSCSIRRRTWRSPCWAANRARPAVAPWIGNDPDDAALSRQMSRHGAMSQELRDVQAVETQFIEANGARIPLIGLGTWDLRGKTCARMVEQALRPRLSPHRHRRDVRQRGDGRRGAARLRRAARRGLHHHQGLVERSARRATSSARPGRASRSSSFRTSISC